MKKKRKRKKERKEKEGERKRGKGGEKIIKKKGKKMQLSFPGN